MRRGGGGGRARERAGACCFWFSFSWPARPSPAGRPVHARILPLKGMPTAVQCCTPGACGVGARAARGGREGRRAARRACVCGGTVQCAQGPLSGRRPARGGRSRPVPARPPTPNHGLPRYQCRGRVGGAVWWARPGRPGEARNGGGEARAKRPPAERVATGERHRRTRKSCRAPATPRAHACVRLKKACTGGRRRTLGDMVGGEVGGRGRVREEKGRQGGEGGCAPSSVSVENGFPGPLTSPLARGGGGVVAFPRRCATQTHPRAHTHKRTNTHPHTHTHKHTQTHARTRKHTQGQSGTHRKNGCPKP